MNGFDMKTAVVVFVFVGYISTYVFAITWWQNKGRFSGLGYFFAGFFLFSLGLSLGVFRGELPILLTVIVANILMFFSNVLFLFGLSAFLKIKLYKSIYYAYTILFTLLYSYFTLIEYDVSSRIIVFSSMILVTYSHMLYLLYIKVKSGDSNFIYSLGVAIVSLAIISSCRAYFAFVEGSPTDYFSISSYETILVMATIVAMTLFVFSLQLMVSGRLFSITEERAALQKVLLKETEKLATTDSLTNLFNRRKIESIVEQEFKKSVQNHRQFSVILCDLDYFKATNDKYGHDVGDQALIEVASILTDLIGRSGEVGRWGGEEFMIVLPKLSLKEALQVANSLQYYLSNYRPKFTTEKEMLTMSFGVADNSFKHRDYQAVVKQADTALYSAKNNGRNRVEYSAELVN